MSLLTDEEVKEIRLSMPAVCHHADLIRHTETFIESKFSSLRAEIEALKQQVEQGKRDAVPEVGWLVENGKQFEEFRYRTWRDGMPAWTADYLEATRYCRRIDAERAHQEDEDAWRIV